MKTLSELRNSISALPCPFAQFSDLKTGADGNLPVSKDAYESHLCFEEGFPEEFAKNPNAASDKGLYILRGDMNRLGEMATREILFSQIGLHHTFNGEVAKNSLGYPLDSMLTYDDGIYLKRVESQAQANQIDFGANPTVIDAYYTDAKSNQRKIFWKTATRIYGLDEQTLHINVDFSRIKQSPYSTNPVLEINEDSFITVAGVSVEAGILSITINTPNNNSPIEINVPNVGKCGISYGSTIVYLVNMPYTIPTLSFLAGCADYYISFCAKKGSSITARLNAEDVKAIQISASPITFRTEGA